MAEVRETGRTSWSIRIGELQPLVIGLFVRDVSGLTSRRVWLPHSVPATPRANGEGSQEAARQWDLWWDRALLFDWTPFGVSSRKVAKCRTRAPGRARSRAVHTDGRIIWVSGWPVDGRRGNGEDRRCAQRA